MLKYRDGRSVTELCPSDDTGTAPDRLRLSDLSKGKVTPIRTKRGRSAIVVLLGGEPRAFDATCPHFGADLSKAKCVGGNISCPWHGYRYSIETGAFVENPNVEATEKHSYFLGEFRRQADAHV